MGRRGGPMGTPLPRLRLCAQHLHTPLPADGPAGVQQFPAHHRDHVSGGAGRLARDRLQVCCVLCSVCQGRYAGVGQVARVAAAWVWAGRAYLCFRMGGGTAHGEVHARLAAQAPAGLPRASGGGVTLRTHPISPAALPLPLGGPTSKCSGERSGPCHGQARVC